MSILDLQAEDLALILSEDEFAVPATYTPSGGAAVSLLAIFSVGPNLDDAQWRAALQATATAYLQAADIVIITTRLSHGAVTNGPFVSGETVTGVTSGSSAVISTVGSGYVEVGSVTGAGFEADETITVLTKSAVLSAVDVIETVVVPDHLDTMTVDGQTWTVQAKAAKFGHLWKLDLRRDLRPTFKQR
jgi:hypothetical protein